MTSEEKQEIINAVLSALATNSKTIDQLTPSTSLSDDDTFEVVGGKRVAYSVLKTLFAAFWSAAIEDGISDNNAIYFSGTKLKDTALPENLLVALDTFTTMESTTPLIKLVHSRIALLDSMGSILDGQEYTPVTGDLVLRSGNYIWRWNGTGWDEDGVPLREHVLYVNKLTGKAYRLENGSLVETIIGGGEVINDLVTGGEEVALSAEMGKELNERLEDIEDSGTGSGVQIWVGTTDTENDTLFIVTNDTPYIRATPSSYDFGEAAVGGASKQKSFTIKGKNLTGNSITAAITGAGFSVSPASIQVADGEANGTVVVTFAPTGSLGERTGKLTLTCGEVTAEVVLSGTAVEQVVPKITLTPATLSLSAMSGGTGTATLHVHGENLEGDITLAVTANIGITLSKNSITPVDGIVDEDITVTFAAGSSNVTGAITASSTGASNATANVQGTVAELPSGFTKVFAIKPAASGSYIDTGYSLNIAQADRAKLKIQVFAKGFGFYPNTPFIGSTNSSLFRLFAQNSNLTYYGFRDSSSNMASFNGTKVENLVKGNDDLYCIEIGADGGSKPYMKDVYGTEVSTAEYAIQNLAQTGNLSLFSYNTSFGQAEIARVKVWYDNALVREFVACKRNSDNVYGMYEKLGTYDGVKGKFFASSDDTKEFTEVQQPNS